MTETDRQVSICAIIACRNEAPYLRYLLPFLAAQDIDVVIIDNESTDDSHRLYREYQNVPIIKVESLAYDNYFSLSQQVYAKHAIASELKHDWIVHHDADEIMQHHDSRQSLRLAVEQADANGYNVMNFDEFVFLPNQDESLYNKDYYHLASRYYFFEPRRNRLNRAWKSSASPEFENSGHRLFGSHIKLDPTSHVLRHYIVLSQEHAMRKYLDRRFDHADLEQGMHGNRLTFTSDNLRLPADHTSLIAWNPAQESPLSRRYPTSKHFWEWT